MTETEIVNVTVKASDMGNEYSTTKVDETLSIEVRKFLQEHKSLLYFNYEEFTDFGKIIALCKLSTEAKNEETFISIFAKIFGMAVTFGFLEKIDMYKHQNFYSISLYTSQMKFEFECSLNKGDHHA